MKDSIKKYLLLSSMSLLFSMSDKMLAVDIRTEGLQATIGGIQETENSENSVDFGAPFEFKLEVQPQTIDRNLIINWPLTEVKVNPKSVRINGELATMTIDEETNLIKIPIIASESVELVTFDVMPVNIPENPSYSLYFEDNIEDEKTFDINISEGNVWFSVGDINFGESAISKEIIESTPTLSRPDSLSVGMVSYKKDNLDFLLTVKASPFKAYVDEHKKQTINNNALAVVYRAPNSDSNQSLEQELPLVSGGIYADARDFSFEKNTWINDSIEENFAKNEGLLVHLGSDAFRLKEDTTYQSELTYTYSAGPSDNEFRITGPSSVKVGEEVDLAIDGTLNEEVSWSIVSDHTDETSIVPGDDSKQATLQVGQEEVSDRYIKVKATINVEENGRIITRTATKDIFIDEADLEISVPSEAFPTETVAIKANISDVDFTLIGKNSPDTTIDANGNVTIGINETASELTVRATSSKNNEIFKEGTIQVKPLEKNQVINYSGIDWRIIRINHEIKQLMMIPKEVDQAVIYDLESNKNSTFEDQEENITLSQKMSEFYDSLDYSLKKYALPVHDSIYIDEQTVVSSKGEAKAFSVGHQDITSAIENQIDLIAKDTDEVPHRWWTRTARSQEYSYAVDESGVAVKLENTTNDVYARPAVMVNIDPAMSYEDWKIKGDATINQGKSITYETTYNGKEPIKWQILDNKETPYADGTFIDEETGKLTIDKYESSKSITIVASTGRQEDKKTISIGEGLTIDIQKDGKSVEQAKPADSLILSSNMEGTEFSVEGATSEETSFNSDTHELFVGLNEQADEVIVRAVNGDLQDEKTLKIIPLKSGDYIFYDGYSWKVGKVNTDENGKNTSALLRHHSEVKYRFNANNSSEYSGSEIEDTMQKFYEENLTKLKKYALPVYLPTTYNDDKTEIDASGNSEPTAFLPSRGDDVHHGKDEDDYRYVWTRTKYSENKLHVSKYSIYDSQYDIKEAKYEAEVNFGVYVNLSNKELDTWAINGENFALQGGTTQFTASPNQSSVEWKLSGATSQDTKIDTNGTLSVAKDEQSKEVTVIANNGTTEVRKKVRINPRLIVTADKSYEEDGKVKVAAKPTQKINFSSNLSGTSYKLADDSIPKSRESNLNNNVLTLGLNEQADSTIKVIAEATNSDGQYQSVTVDLNVESLEVNDEINYDGYDWKVLRVENQQALMVTKYLHGTTIYDKDTRNNVYLDSDLHKAMLSFYNNNLNRLKSYALPVDLPYKNQSKTDTSDTTKVSPNGLTTAFALSTADLNTSEAMNEPIKRLAADLNGSGHGWWLRSYSGNQMGTVFKQIRRVSGSGAIGHYDTRDKDYLRPAVYVDLKPDIN